MANEIRRVNPSLRLALTAGFALALALPSSTAAHPEWSPIRVNRYTKLVVSPGHVRLVYTLLLGDGPALPARKSVDRNADGRIDEHEKAMLGARAQVLVAAGLQVSLDGAPPQLSAPSIDVGLAGDAVAPAPYSVDLAYTIDAAPGVEHTLRVDDRVEVPSEGDTEITIEDTQPPSVRVAYQGRAPGSDAGPRVFTFRGPRFSVLEDRSVTMRWRDAVTAPARSALRRCAWPISGGAILVALLAIAIYRRRA